MCYTYIGLILLLRYASGYSHLRDMSHYCARMVIRGTHFHKFLRVFTRRLRVWNPVLFCAPAKNAAACAVRGTSGSTYTFEVNDV